VLMRVTVAIRVLVFVGVGMVVIVMVAMHGVYQNRHGYSACGVHSALGSRSFP
jgi:hypothetical protein